MTISLTRNRMIALLALGFGLSGCSIVPYRIYTVEHGRDRSSPRVIFRENGDHPVVVVRGYRGADVDVAIIDGRGDTVERRSEHPEARPDSFELHDLAPGFYTARLYQADELTESWEFRVLPSDWATPAHLDEISQRIAAAGGDMTALEGLDHRFSLPVHYASATGSVSASDSQSYAALGMALAGLFGSMSDIQDPLLSRMKILSDAMQASGVSVDVTFNATGGTGARVRYKVITDDGKPHRATRLTNEAAATMSCGFYYIWTERNGKATSATEEWFEIVTGMALPVDLEE